MKNLKQVAVGSIRFLDRALWGNVLGRLVIVAVLVGAGVPMLAANTAGEQLNKVLDEISGPE